MFSPADSCVRNRRPRADSRQLPISTSSPRDLAENDRADDQRRYSNPVSFFRRGRGTSAGECKRYTLSDQDALRVRGRESSALRIFWDVTSICVRRKPARQPRTICLAVGRIQ